MPVSHSGNHKGRDAGGNEHCPCALSEGLGGGAWRRVMIDRVSDREHNHGGEEAGAEGQQRVDTHSVRSNRALPEFRPRTAARISDACKSVGHIRQDASLMQSTSVLYVTATDLVEIGGRCDAH